MSNYGPSGGPYRDQPHDPWQSQHHPQVPYEEPSDPWGGQDAWGGAPTSPQAGGYEQSPAYGQQQYAYGGGETTYPQYDNGYAQATQQHSPAPVWNAPGPGPLPQSPPPRRRGVSPGLLVLLIVLALLVVGGVGGGLWYLGKDKRQDAGANPGASTSAAPSPREEDPTGAPSPDTASSTDPRFAAKGQCLLNKGTNKRPELQLVPCGPKTFEVLQRFDGTADYQAKCKKVAGYAYHYFYDSEVDSLDFVLCLKRRP